MKPEDELRRATAPGPAGADFRAEKVPGLVLITPLNSRASAWLRSEVSREASWSGDTLLVEIGFFPGLADAVIDAGFVFERDAYPN